MQDEIKHITKWQGGKEEATNIATLTYSYHLILLIARAKNLLLRFAEFLLNLISQCNFELISNSLLKVLQ